MKTGSYHFRKADETFGQGTVRLFVFILLTMGFSFANARTTPAKLMYMGFDPRAMGMGRAYAANSAGAGALFGNPAGLTDIKRAELLTAHSMHPRIGGLFFDVLAVGFRRSKWKDYTFGAGLVRLSSTGFERRDEDGYYKGEFGYVHDLSAVGAGKAYGEISLGLVLYFEQRYFDGGGVGKSRLGIGCSLGATLSVLEEETYKLAMGLTLGGRLRTDATGDPAISWLRGGLALKILQGKLGLALDLRTTQHQNTAYMIGAEYIPFKGIVVQGGLEWTGKEWQGKSLSISGERMVTRRVSVRPAVVYRSGNLFGTKWFVLGISWH